MGELAIIAESLRIAGDNQSGDKLASKVWTSDNDMKIPANMKDSCNNTSSDHLPGLTLVENLQQRQMENWKIQQDTQTKMFQMQEDVTHNKTQASDKQFKKWDEIVRN